MPQPLLEPYRLGTLDLPNRVVMSPMTRNRGDNPDNVATELVAEYYAQRASAGLIISEGTFVSRQAVGFINVPGMYSPAQVAGWSKVTRAVHDAGGRIFAQLWHVGAVSHPDLLGGELPVAPSAINPGTNAYTSAGFKPTITPRALETHEVATVVEDFRRAAGNAAQAGFDGVELHGANGYLFHQFFARSMNRRNDRYGGSIENRARLLFEVLDAVGAEMPSDRVGVRVNPGVHNLSGIEFDDETLPLFEYVARRLDERKIGYLHVMEPINGIENLPETLTRPSVAANFRPFFSGTLIAAVDYTQATGNEAIERGYADLVAFGRAFIANPDLVARLEANASLAMPFRETFYSGGARGYVDYPTLDDASHAAETGSRVGRTERYAETRSRSRVNADEVA